jgi:hypothetical protein
MYVNYAIKYGDRAEAALLILFKKTMAVSACQNGTIKQKCILKK